LKHGLKRSIVHIKMELRKNMLLQEIRRNGPIGRSELERNLGMSKSRLCEVINDDDRFKTDN